MGPARGRPAGGRSQQLGGRVLALSRRDPGSELHLGTAGHDAAEMVIHRG
jgi:hypothetical protein